MGVHSATPPPGKWTQAEESLACSENNVAENSMCKDDILSSAVTLNEPKRTRFACQFHLHMDVPGFDLVPRIIGRGGCNTKRIFDASGAKIRVRGRGSGHIELRTNAEATVPLMVAVSCGTKDGFIL